MFQTARVCDRSVVGNASCKIFSINVEKGEVHLHENQSVTYKNRLYSYLEYELDPTETVLLLCGEEPTPHRATSSTMGLDMGPELAWFFFIVSILSVGALILTLIIYGMFKELRTLPGWNLINVMVALTYAQTALILSSLSSSTTLCHIVGIATHYGYLVGFFFANVIAIDIYRTFGRKGTFKPAPIGKPLHLCDLLESVIIFMVRIQKKIRD